MLTIKHTETERGGLFEAWLDDVHVGELFLEGTTISQLAQEFHRTQGAIRSRLKKLGLIE